MMNKEHEVIIIGGGPAGLTAGLYAARAKLKCLLVEKMPLLGGQIINAWRVENYPGFPGGVAGPELMANMENQAREFGLAIETADVAALQLDDDWRYVITGTGEQHASQAVIVASGASLNRLGIEGEDAFIGRGVSYCATCDGFFFKDKNVLLVGGGDAAIEEALFLTRFVNTVTVVHRRDTLRATKILQERAFANKKIDFLWDTVLERISGTQAVELVTLKNLRTGAVTEKKTDGIFVFVGTSPNTGFLEGVVRLDEGGFIITNDSMETSVPGIFAAGDSRKKLVRQVSTAVGDGATAAVAAEKYLESFRA